MGYRARQDPQANIQFRQDDTGFDGVLVSNFEMILHTDEIHGMFSEISPTYDRLNLLLSFGLDRLWRRRVLRAVEKWGQVHLFALAGATTSNKWTCPHLSILDVCTGTGDLAILLAKHGHEVIGLDFCAPMLEKARQKGDSVTFIEGNAAELPYPDRSFHAVTNAFSLRNLVNLSGPPRIVSRAAQVDLSRAIARDLSPVFSETFRVLVPGGVGIFVDLTRPTSWLAPFHRLYLNYVVPRIGKLISRNETAYHYLSQSIFNFPEPLEIQKLFLDSSFSPVLTNPLSGGICTMWIAKKPA